MPYDPSIHHRRSIRLQGYDYRQAGAYFITIVTQGRQRLFGTITNGVPCLNPIGTMVATHWLAIPAQFPTTTLDAWVIMPDHVHGIIVLHDAPASPDGTITPAPDGAASRPALSQVLAWFKRITTNAYFHGVHTAGWPTVDRRLWQRNYWEHIIRTEAELSRIRSYIATNPARWKG